MTWANKIVFILIIVVIAFITLAYGGVHQPVIAAFYTMIAGGVLVWVIDGFVTGEIRVSSSLLQIPIITAGAYGFVQAVQFGTTTDSTGLSGVPRSISLEPFVTQVSAMRFVYLAVFFGLVLVSLDSVRRVKILVAFITIFGFVYAFFAILQGILSPDKIYGIYEVPMGVPYGSFVNRHNFAAIMEMTIAIPIALVVSGVVGKDKRLLYITAISLMGVALLLSGSRGGLVALIAEIIVVLLISTRTRNRRDIVVKGVLAAALLITIVAGAVIIGGESSLTRIADSASSRDVSSNRFHIWSGALRVAVSYFPLGSGLGTFGIAYTQFDTASGLERVEQAHNDYLQMLTDAGIPGLIIGGFFLYLLYAEARRNLKTTNRFRRSIAVGSIAGCSAILVHSAFDFVLHTAAISVMFLTLVALLVASGRKYPDDTMSDEKYRESKHPFPKRNVSPRLPRLKKAA